MVKYPMMLKQMTDDETREYYLKRIERLCLESIKKGKFYKNPQYTFWPTLEQEEWMNKKRLR